MISRVLLILALLTGGAFAQGPILPGPGLPVAVAGGSPVFTPTANPAIIFNNGAGAGDVTFNSVNLGTATSDRIIIVGVVNLDAGRVIASIEVGSGVFLTRGVSSSGGTVASNAELWYGSVPTGTSANIKVTYTGGAVQLCGILVGALSGQSGGASATPSAPNAKPLDFANDPQTFPSGMTVPSGGIGVVLSATGSSGSAALWTSTTTSAGDYWISTASGNTLNMALAHTITPGSWNPTVSNMGAFGGNSMVALAWAQ